MKYQEKISPELKKVLLATTNKVQRLEVAERNNVSIHTLNSVLQGKRKVTENNKQCITELTKVAIANANKYNQSLMNYYNTIL